MFVLLAAHVDIIPAAVTGMTQASGIVIFRSVRALGCELLPTMQRVTLLAHPFGVVLMIHMGTIGDCPSSSFSPWFLLGFFLGLVVQRCTSHWHWAVHLLVQSFFNNELPMNYVPVSSKFKVRPISLIMINLRRAAVLCLSQKVE